MLPPGLRAQGILDVFSDLVTIATCIADRGFLLAGHDHALPKLDQRSETANIPLVISQSALFPIGLILMAVLIAVRLITKSWSWRAAQATTL